MTTLTPPTHADLAVAIRALTDSQVAYDREAGTVTVGAQEVAALVTLRCALEGRT